VRHHIGDIFIGDLVLAIAAVDSSDAQTNATIARLLGFRIEQLEVPELEASAPLEAAELRSPPRQTDPATTQDTKDDKFKPAIELPPDERLQYDVTEPVIERIPSALRTAPQRKISWPAWERATRTKPRYRPLFWDQWTRGILSEAVATSRPAGALDLPRALEVLAHGTAPAELPRVRIPTLARGCQVMVDVSPGMAPFARDCWHLIEALRSVVGRELVQVFYFKDCPIYGVETEGDVSRVPFQPPPRTTPVLLLSDLGIAAPAFSPRRATVQDWLQFARQLRIAGCPLLALVPYPRQRWPRRLTKGMNVLLWDRGSTASAVRRAKERI
jgi:hypothetical protein